MRVKAVNARRRTPSSGSPSFLSLTLANLSRPKTLAQALADPAWTTIPFTTKAGLDSALSSITGTSSNVYIYYNGTGILTISSSTSIPYRISAKNPSGMVCVDFGTFTSFWGTATGGNYVKFSYTGTSNVNAVTFISCSNMVLYGGYLTTNDVGGDGCVHQAPLTNCRWIDAYVSDVGGNGFAFRAQDASGNASFIRGYKLRLEVNKFAMNPTWDSHTDKGSGDHGIILHGTTGEITGNTFAVYAHDSLTPGATSAGKTWPQGGGGSACEPGNDVGGPISNNTYYIKGANLLFTPWHTGVVNPGTDTTKSPQTGGNVIDAWGSIPLNGDVFAWIEGSNCTGAVFHGVAGGWQPGSPAIKVLHGRGTTMNQYTGTGNLSVKYATGLGIDYQDYT